MYISLVCSCSVFLFSFSATDLRCNRRPLTSPVQARASWASPSCASRRCTSPATGSGSAPATASSSACPSRYFVDTLISVLQF